MLPDVRLQDRVEVLKLSVSDEANYEHLSLTINQLNTAHMVVRCDLVLYVTMLRDLKMPLDQFMQINAAKAVWDELCPHLPQNNDEKIGFEAQLHNQL